MRLAMKSLRITPRFASGISEQHVFRRRLYPLDPDLMPPRVFEVVNPSHVQRLRRSSSSLLSCMRGALRRYSGPVTSPNDDFFRYTSGRWLCDEERQLALRYQWFDVDALKQVVLDCTGADAVLDIQKLAEGRSNKVFLVQLKNSPSVIARIPTPLSGPPHLVTASEVATMDFVRNRLGLHQVPRVLAWCSRAAETPVGAEYIIMDQAVGVRLDTVWSNLSRLQKLHLVRQWAEFESPLVQAFSGTSGYGSLYYRADVLAQKTSEIVRDGGADAEFVIGPSVEDRLWSKEDFCDTLDVDRGSCMLSRARNGCQLTRLRARRRFASGISGRLAASMDPDIRFASQVRHGAQPSSTATGRRRASSPSRPVQKRCSLLHPERRSPAQTDVSFPRFYPGEYIPIAGGFGSRRGCFSCYRLAAYRVTAVVSAITNPALHR